MDTFCCDGCYRSRPMSECNGGEFLWFCHPCSDGTTRRIVKVEGRYHEHVSSHDTLEEAFEAYTKLLWPRGGRESAVKTHYRIV